MKNKIPCLIISFLFFLGANAQKEKDSSYMQFHLQFGGKPLELNADYSTNKDTLQISMLKFYISGIQLQYFDGTIFTESESFHLIDAEKPESLQIPLTINKDKIISKVILNVGIDSIINNSGALAGDLDPVNGMYWAWQSGYINLKIEGQSPSCKTRKNQFHFHIGGYLPPHYALRRVELIYDKKATNVNIAVDLKNFLSNVNLSQINSIMIPGKTAMELADISTKMFRIP